MKCPRCLNENPRLFAKGKRGYYCRACIGFKRQLIEEEMSLDKKEVSQLNGELEMTFELTPMQKSISMQLKELIKTQDILLYAVCGAGKTEMLLDTLQDCFQNKKRVAVAIARRQVVLELAERLSAYFPHVRIIPVCQGHTEQTDADMIVCTTHQLYRYYQAFDVLVLDEPDAFPFKGNAVLQGIAKTSCRGHRIFLTATPDQDLMTAVEQKKMVMLSLNQRPHGYPLPEPVLTIGFQSFCFIQLVYWIKRKRREKRQAMVFVPTIRLARQMKLFFSRWVSCCVCTSKTEQKDKVIETFRNRQVQFCFCTSILERGVTFAGVDVAVFWADHPVFDEASLVQIAGRAGRKKEDPYGEVQFYAFSRKACVEKCIDRIKRANQAMPVVQ